MKTCLQCQSSFEVTERDRELLKQVSPQYGGQTYLIPEPTLCWKCKLQNRLSFRNERSLYRRQCDFSGKDIVSIYSPDKPYKVYHQDIWWSDQWDPLEYGRDFDFNRPFFEQFDELLHEVPLMALWLINPQNAEFNNAGFGLKDSYMSICSDMGEQLLYCYGVDHSNHVLDSAVIKDSELVYECVDGEKLYHCYFSQYLSNCSDVYFSYDLTGCRHCFGCVNLKNKEYHIFNEPVTKEEWDQKMAEFKFTSKSIAENMSKLDTLKQSLPLRSNMIINCENVVGDNLYHSKNMENCYDARKSEDCKNVFYSPWGTKHALDCYAVGELSWAYELMGGGVGTNKSAFVMNYANGPVSTYYSTYMLNGTSDCFGSVSLKKARYCILNKQYSKQEYEALVPKIIEHMKETGDWGQFFPSSMSLFGYNETKAQEFFPLSREQALEKDYLWSDYERPQPIAQKQIQGSDLPDSIESVPDDILNWVIACEDSGELYKITRLELNLYRKLGLPIPRKAPNLRYMNRLSRRHPIFLWDRTCDQCHKNIKSTYAPDAKETVYCESCYLKEVY